LFEFLILVESVKNDGGMKKIVHDSKNIMHEMLKFISKITSINISIPNHISNHENHV